MAHKTQCNEGLHIIRSRATVGMDRARHAATFSRPPSHHSVMGITGLQGCNSAQTSCQGGVAAVPGRRGAGGGVRGVEHGNSKMLASTSSYWIVGRYLVL